MLTARETIVPTFAGGTLDRADQVRDNPDKLRADWEAGVPWEEIRKRPPMPEGKTMADMRIERKQ